MAGDKQESEERDRKVFQFLFQSHEVDFKNMEVNVIALTANFLLVGWGWGSDGFLGLWRPLLLPSSLFYGCVGLVVLLLLQIIVGVLYQKQVFFLLQVKIFRFVLLCPMVAYCIQLGQSSTLGAAYFTAGALLVILAFLLNYLVFNESFMDGSIRSFTVPRTVYLLVLEVVLLVLQNTNQHEPKLKQLILASVLLLAMLLRESLMDTLQVNFELRLNKIVLWCNLLLVASMLAYKLANGELEAVTHGCITVVGLLGIIVANLLSSFEQPWILFQTPEFLHNSFTQYVESAELAIAEADQKTAEKEYFSSVMIGYVYYHCRTCTDSDCPIKHEMSRVELPEFVSPAHVARMSGRFIKKMNSIFEEQQKQNPEDLNVKVSHLKLVLIHSRYKSKGLELLADIEDMSTSWQHRYLTYTVRKKVEALDSGFLEVGEQAKLEEDIALFRYDLYFILNLMMDFWSQFFEERVDLNKLISVSTKLFPFRQEIEQLWNRIKQVESFATAHTMLLYAEYMLQILNNEDEAQKIQEEADRMKSRLRDDKTIRLKEQEECGVMILSLNDVNLGEIKQVNSYAANLFGYSRKDALKKRINDFMPKIFAEHHDAYLQKFTANRNKSVNTDQRVLLGRHRNHFIFPIKLQLRRQLSNYSDDILFMASIGQVKFRRPEVYCVVDEEGTISDMSSSWKYLFKGSSDSGIQSVVKNFWSLICGDEKPANTFMLTVGLKQWGLPAWSCDLYITSLGFLSENCGYILRGELVKNCQEFLKQQDQQRAALSTLKFELTDYGFLGQFCSPQAYDGNQFRGTMPFAAVKPSASSQLQERVFENYGVGIKSYRLIDNDLYRVEEEVDSNWDDFDFEGPQNNDSEKRQLLQSAKEGSLKNSSNRSITCMRYMTHLLVAIIVGLVLYQHFYDEKMFVIEFTRLSTNEHKAKTQTLASYLICRIAAERANLNLSAVSLSIDDLRARLQEEVNQVDIDPAKKQRLMKLIYLHRNDQIQSFLTDDTLNFDFTESDNSLDLNKILESILLPFGVLSIFLLERLYQRLQINIFSIFLELDERLVRHLYHNCSQFVRRIEKESDRSDDITLCPVPLLEDTVEQACGDNHKVKKLKNKGIMNRAFFIKITVVLLVVLAILGVEQLLDAMFNQNTSDALSLQQAILHMAPVSSMLLMRTVLQFQAGQKVPLPANEDPFYSMTYAYDIAVVSMLRKITPEVAASMNELLYTNMCVNDLVNSSQCQTVFNGVLALGGNQAVNLFANHIRLFQQQIAAGKFNPQSAQDLLNLEFVYIKPLMDRLTELADSAVALRISYDRYLHEFMVALILLITISGDYLVVRYVIGRMLRELHLTRQLINFIPSLKDTSHSGYTSVPQQ